MKVSGQVHRLFPSAERGWVGVTCLQQHRAGLAATVGQLAVVRAIPVSCRTQQTPSAQLVSMPGGCFSYTHRLHTPVGTAALCDQQMLTQGRHCRQASSEPRPTQPRPYGAASGARLRVSYGGASRSSTAQLDAAVNACRLPPDAACSTAGSSPACESK